MASLFISRYRLKPEKRDDFVRTLKAMYEGGREFIEQQTNFCFYGFGRDPDEFVAIESWKSEDVVNALRATEEFKQGFTALMSCASAPMFHRSAWGEQDAVNAKATKRVHASNFPSSGQTSRSRCMLFTTFISGGATVTRSAATAAVATARVAARARIVVRIAAENRLGGAATRCTGGHLPRIHG